MSVFEGMRRLRGAVASEHPAAISTQSHRTTA